MGFSISSVNKEQNFENKEFISIGSKPEFDYTLDLGFDYMLTVQFKDNKCIVLNQFNNPKFTFKGQAFDKIEVDNVCKIKVEGTDEFITVKVKQEVKAEPTVSMNSLYGNEKKAKLEDIKSGIEGARTAIIKQVSYTINDLKKKISMNSKSGILLHGALFLACFVCAFGLSNYLTGLPLKDAGSVIQMPANLKLIFMYTLVIFGIALVLKQGTYINLQKKSGAEMLTPAVDNMMFSLSAIFFVAIYAVNVLYYIAPGGFPIFAVLISMFFVGTAAVLAIACGYFKNNNVIYSKELDKVEYREDFEKVLKDYRNWIEMYINNLSETKIKNIKDKLFNLQIKSVGETILGILTAPFLAYGVSNTLAMCFPEAAGWVRISGLRFSPVFLVLATFLIVFAFFMFVNAFWSNKKILASNVLKQDGFSNYLTHGVEILGLEGVRRTNIDMRRSFGIGIAIILIEFSMNVSYFAQTIGGDLSGLMLSLVAALVPTALLIAETYMLSQTKFEIYACEELIAKLDRD
ncbi:hypothetical protein IJV79_01865 [bacterium]|nr:hypothetical protein [bacterium]